MNRKKIAALILSFAFVVLIGAYLINYTAAKADEKIMVMEYTPPIITGENGYQIDKYENIENNQWIDENNVLSLTKKGDFKNPDSTTSVRYCSVYNLNTNDSKDFKNVDIDEFLGVSPDNKYVLYSEPRAIPKLINENGTQTEEAKKAYESGDLYHKAIKVLNLSTGEITDIKTEKVNSFAEFKWVGNNKILENYCSGKWRIADISGKVYIEGNYNSDYSELVRIAGVDDIKDLGDNVEGRFYYTQDVNGTNGGRAETKICSIDIKTKVVKAIYTNKNSLGGSKKGKTIVIDNFNDNGKAVDGVFLNRTFGEIIMDESGKIIRNIDLPKGIQNSEFILSPDGTKAAYLEYPNEIKPIGDSSKSDNNGNTDICLKVIDIKTGDIKEIVKSSSLKDENDEVEYRNIKRPSLDESEKDGKIQVKKGIENICWSSKGKELSFTYGNSSKNNTKINSFIVSFDK
ncbi:hypothetical protein NNC19_19030 [Clostridium sp. SHJSY1]|uniref:hypothetical protein n=1 Tax=Clostridium sp. SHJSY1 TaxID=2942483 RepID=UPI002874FCC1|nr:hypothetical protein [Clostridium sp. SHJSY1]MDS0527789.1 hypothetical protein [Clostridium sp. SHJSY1]